jgi:ATP-dependent Lhr-like helicase
LKRQFVLDVFHPAVAAWFGATFASPTPAQRMGWPAIARGESTLILAPTGSGKTLAAFLWCINRLVFGPPPLAASRCRVLYISPLKALAVDVERNLRAPLAGIFAAARERGDAAQEVAIAIRTGDTPAKERARFGRHPPDILITTPESLFLLLSSRARERLASVDTVIIDEIHALVPTKRGAHLALSLERLGALGGRARPPLQRIGLSATQRPLDEVARFLGGTETGTTARRGRSRSRRHGPPSLDELVDDGTPRGAFRRVRIVDASEPKRLALTVEVPVEDMARLEASTPAAGGDVPRLLTRHSIWSSVYPSLLAHIRAHRSTLLFVNSRRLSERLAGALNDLAGEPLVRAHHGSLAREARAEVEEQLTAGTIRGLVATSSLELGIDMGAIDLVIQIEAPPSVASGLQRVGRAGHQAGAVSTGIIVPKYRSDLLACAAVTRAMHDGRVESIHYPRNPLDVLAQHLVSMVATGEWTDTSLYACVRQSAPFASLTRPLFDGVLDMLSGRYPSDDFAELRPRLTWNRTTGALAPRDGALRVAIANAGTIPDRGLYGVFLAGADGRTRIGELDEEMVFETPPGEVFVLGASSWRVEATTHDRVLVSPAPGETGKMPFWKADQVGRPAELGRAIGVLVRELREMPPGGAAHRLTSEHHLDARAAENALRYLADQAATGAVPDDRTVVIERCTDEVGDWRVCVLSPFGGRVHAPWAMAAAANIRSQTGLDVDVMWGDDGFVARFPDTERPPEVGPLVPDPDEIDGLLTRELGGTAHFAARFRESAARALLLPRRRPGVRTPLWRQRKRASDLLAVASRFASFPIVLEAYREILRDEFDVSSLRALLTAIRRGRVRTASLDSTTPSPFAASLLFNYVATYLYDGDAPLAERRAQALSIDPSQLRALMGPAELRDLLDGGVLAELGREAQRVASTRAARSDDELHDLLLGLGDLGHDELASRCVGVDVAAALSRLAAAGRVVEVVVAGRRACIASEDAARYRDALGVAIQAALPPALLTAMDAAAATRDLVRRYARTHGPFSTEAVAGRLGLEPRAVEDRLLELESEGRVVRGEFSPGGHGPEWLDREVLQSARRRSLATTRRQVAPVPGDGFARFLLTWQSVGGDRRGADALLDAVQQLQGVPLLASALEADVLPARVADYDGSLLDTLIAAGEVVWVGVERVSERDGRVALYLADHVSRLRLAPAVPQALSARAGAVHECLRARGASFFADIRASTGGGFPQDTVDALWELVWLGLATNDAWQPVRRYLGRQSRRRAPRRRPAFASRREIPPTTEGRWSLVPPPSSTRSAATRWSAATAEQLLARYGVVTREVAAAEALPGGFSPIYESLKALEAAGRIRRGYFVEGLGGAQFATPAALDALRAHRESRDARPVLLASSDPANPYGTLLPWPRCGSTADGWRGPMRSMGTRVVLVDGAAAAYLFKGSGELTLWLPDEEPARSRTVSAVASLLGHAAVEGLDGEPGLLLAAIDGRPALEHPNGEAFAAAGFSRTAGGWQLRVAGRYAGDAP